MATDSVRFTLYRSEGRVASVRFPYCPERVALIKKIDGRRWNPKTKCWEVPDNSRREAPRYHAADLLRGPAGRRGGAAALRRHR